MPKDEETKERKRMVVEEVSPEEKPEPQIPEEAALTPEEEKIEEVKQEEPKEEKEEIKKELEPEAPKTQEAPPQKSSSLALWIIVPGFFLLGALLGGIFFYQRGVNTAATQTPAPTSEAVGSTSPTPTPSAEVDLEKYEVKILNGSGIAGEAGKARSLLEKAGFTISSTGNASTYDYTKTIIQAKSDVDESFLTALSGALSEGYSVDSKTQTLQESSTDKVVVIVGSTKN